jgi:hypothetical protein
MSTRPSLVLDVCELLRSLLFPFDLCAPYVPRLTEPFMSYVPLHAYMSSFLEMILALTPPVSHQLSGISWSDFCRYSR